MTLQEFNSWIMNERVGRTILTVQQHHTFLPDYSGFRGDNHFDLQRSMKNYHVNHNGWNNIGQHFTSFPDGTIMTGRSLEISPACIRGNNANSICMEHLGNFDTGGDVMSNPQLKCITGMVAAVCVKFSIPVNTDKIIYHHWFNLSSGDRNNGEGMNKSCPGTGFIGGNKVEDCQNQFLPLVNTVVNELVPVSDMEQIIKYASVTANRLNIRKGASTSFAKITSRGPLRLGSVIRVFKEHNGWYKISGSQENWVSARYAREVRRAVVSADSTNVRSGPGVSFNRIGSLLSGQELFLEFEINNWCKINMEEKWIDKSILIFS